jgi:rhodanese-related sulfurtransferase
MKPEGQRLRLWLGAGMLAGSLLPLLLYWLLMGGAFSVSVGEARRLLDRPDPPVILLDVRSPEACAADPVIGAVNWPAADIAAVASPKDVPPALQGKKLLLIDEDGLGGAKLVREMRKLPGLEVLSVCGGVASWNTDTDGGPSPLRLHPMSLVNQWLAVITGFGIKPVHLVLCVLVILWLWPQRAPDLVALRWGLLIFWLGELACSVAFWSKGGWSDFWDYVHNIGNSAGFSFTTYAVLEGLDRRVIKYSAGKDRCAALSLCRACLKYAEVPCGLRRVFSLIIPATILVARMPLCVPLQVVSYQANVLGWVTNYSHTISDQMFELWYCSVLPIALLTASWLVLLCRRQDPVTPAKILFAAATGPLGFGLVRLLVFAAYRNELMWANLWEETTELLYVASVAVVLWIFRATLFVKPAPSAPERLSSATAA